MTFDENTLNGLAGVAALVNSLLMWPTLRALKRMGPVITEHENRIARLERRRKRAK